MIARSLAVLFLIGGLAAADSHQDLEFAQKLALRGYNGMAKELLQKMAASSDPKEQQAGRYGLALLVRIEASREGWLFLTDLESGRKPPRVSRDDVIALYKKAITDVESYAQENKSDSEAHFLLAGMLEEYAKFLTGADYPEDMAKEQKKLVEDNKEEVNKTYERVIAEYHQVAAQGKDEVDRLMKTLSQGQLWDNPVYIRTTRAQLDEGLAQFNWATLFPGGPLFINHIEKAIDDLDAFSSVHYEELMGAYAQLYLGRAFLERALRLGDASFGDYALNYFQTIYTQLVENPSNPNVGDLIAQAFYWYTKAANSLAIGEGALKKSQPVYFQNTIKAGVDLSRKLTTGQNDAWALKARLEIARAHAEQKQFDQAVSLGGAVLSAARFAGETTVARSATNLLTGWVANVQGGANLSPDLLMQIGESLANQNRTTDAVTFYEKAIGASKTTNEKERFAYPAELRIAQLYRAGGRLFAAKEIAMRIVKIYIDSKKTEETPLGQTAGEACNQARLALKEISQKTGRPQDDQEYQTVLALFRKTFPGHRENADAAFSSAMDAWNDHNYVKAAEDFASISKSSPNYWRARYKVADAYRMEAYQQQGKKDDAKAKEMWGKCLATAQKVVSDADAHKGETGADTAREYGQLYEVVAFGALGKWDDALKTASDYRQRYPDAFLLQGEIISVQIEANLNKGNLQGAEARLAELEKTVPESPWLKGWTGARRMVFLALRKAFDPMEEGAARRAMAGRAADIYNKVLSAEAHPAVGQLVIYAQVLDAAARYDDAAQAYQDAAASASRQSVKDFYTRKAAEMQLQAAKKVKSKNPAKFLKIIEHCRKLFTDVLIVKKGEQKNDLTALGTWQKFPAQAVFDALSRDPDLLYVTAQVYGDANPPYPGVDGRWIAVRLLTYCRNLTRPELGPNNKQHYVSLWWDSTEEMLQNYVSLAQSQAGAEGRQAASEGYTIALQITQQYTKMDGPERVKRIQALFETLKSLIK